MDKKIQSSICRRCGRNLKDAISRERGYGPECFRKMAKSGKRKLFEVNDARQG